jgi:hypothetical protein
MPIMPPVMPAPDLPLNPPEFLHGESSMPNLRHVPDLIPVELHHIHIVCLHPLAGWWTGATLASMHTREDAVRTDTLALIIRGKGLEFIASVRDKRQQALHPVCLLLQGPHVSKRLSLCRKRRIRLTVLIASFPSFPSLTVLWDVALAAVAAPSGPGAVLVYGGGSL